MRTVLVLTGVCVSIAAVLATGPWERDNEVPTGPRVPVVVELFTSEGCSSCPPADALLGTLRSDQPIPGVDVIVLSEHVDYWNRLGWQDPFSSPTFTARQKQYADARVTADVYTPQVVVDGRFEAVGNDAGAVRRAITQARREPKALLSVTFTEARDGSPTGWVDVRIDKEDLKVPAAWLTIAITEDNVSSDVRRGENANRRLHHTGVVRHLVRLSREAAVAGAGVRETVAATEPVPLPFDWQRANLRAVAFLQGPSGATVVAAGSATLRP